MRQLSIRLALVLAALPGRLPAQEAEPKTLAELEKLLGETYSRIEADYRTLPRDLFDPVAVLEKTGRDPSSLLNWVAGETAWLPYRGLLKGPAGTLADRGGNSLDRSALLATLLQAVGFKARLAHGSLSAEAAQAFLAAAQPPTREALSGDAAPSSVKVSDRAAEHAAGLEALVLPLAQPVGGMADDRLAAARDHWWVEHHIGGEWQPLDPASPEKPLLTTAAETVELPRGVTWPLQVPVHEVEIAVVIEVWDAGKLVEKPVTQSTIRPFEQFGRRVTLEHHPLHAKAPADESSEAAIRKAALETTEWLPIILAGDRYLAKPSFDDQGNINQNPDLSPASKVGSAVGGLFGGLGGATSGDTGKSAEKRSVLTAEWAVLTFRSPGCDPRVVRREVFDLLGPAARAAAAPAKPELKDAARLDRALALRGSIEWLFLPAHAPWHLALQATTKHELDQRRTVMAALQEPDRQKRRAMAARVSDLGPLLWVAAARRSMNPSRGESWIGSPNAIGLHYRLAEGPGGKLVERAVLDLASCPVLPATAAAGLAAVLRQGVADAVAEDLAFGDAEGVVGSALDVLEAARAQGSKLVTVRGPGDAALAAIGLPVDTAARVAADLAAGQLVIIPEKPVALGGAPRSAWWRVDPATGETVAVLDTGYHATTAEYTEDNTVISTRTMIRRRPTREFWGQRASDIARQAGFDPATNPGIVTDIMNLQRFLRYYNLLL